ncbi:serine hydrolase domain-containing protein [Peristeroidobacter agariperforans]|uniref:serine hydrolase domain-containing protein n=1 Tax=Peristeroidobacter agariperforans TaxID=268404 RepID=UPI00101CCD36|nr:serine hydrolase domain-containing protein [Peristeroidobacter agariperforans]
MNALKLLLPALACLGLNACGDDDASPTPPADDPFVAIDRAAEAAYRTQGIEGMGLAIYNRDGEKVFERMYGNFSATQRVPIASASKLVSGVVLFRLIDQGFLSLDSTTAQVLGWSGEKGTITLRHLLSFTSGLPPENFCTYRETHTLAECVGEISQMELLGLPGTRFEYGSTHLHVAARMAEVVTGDSWNEIFAAQVRDPLGMPADIVYYANPVAATGTNNPLPAGGLIVSMQEYERLLHFVFNKGQWQGAPLLRPEIFDVQRVQPYANAAIVTTPASSVGTQVRYGLTAWLECSTPTTGCSAISSPGAFGFNPWLDRDVGYYAILGMQVPNDRVGFVVDLKQQLKPLIAEALAR